MAANVLVDSGFLSALVRRRDTHRLWAVARAAEHPPPWHCCEAVLSEVMFLLGAPGLGAIAGLVQRGAVVVSFSFADHSDRVLQLMTKYSNVPMSLADACLVRLTEVLDDPLVLTTDRDFEIYRRHGRSTVPCVLPK